MRRVLIVDDQPAFRRQLRMLLERACAQVGEAGDIPEAVEQVKRQEFDLAVVDVMLPGVSGVEGVPLLKAVAPALRVILISAYRDRAEVFQRAAKDVNAEAFVPKDDLDLPLVKSWLSANRAPTGGER